MRAHLFCLIYAARTYILHNYAKFAYSYVYFPDLRAECMTCRCVPSMCEHVRVYQLDMAEPSAFDEAVEFVAKKLGVAKLRDQQIPALRQIVGGHDVFINYLGTGTRLLRRVCACVKSI